MKAFVEQYNQSLKFRAYVMLWCFFGIIAPYLPYIKDRYTLAFGAIIVQLMTMAIIHWIIIRALFEWRKRSFNGALVLSVMTVVYFIIAVLMYGATPHVGSGNPNHAPETGVVYVTHRDDCPFCTVAIGNVRSAIAVYNGTHPIGPNVRLVNINDDTTLAKEVSNRVEKSGSIFYQPTSDKMARTHYVRSDENGNPVALTSNEIYQLIEDVVHHHD